MKSKETNIDLLTEYLKANKVDFSIDENPSPSKLQKIVDALRKKDTLINNSVTTYQLSIE